jgi:hypothetical protein
MQLHETRRTIAAAQDLFKGMMVGLATELRDEATIKIIYARYLSMQYHLTRGVQGPLYAAAAHPELIAMPELRRWIVAFADEEAPHYRIAEEDLRNLGETVGPLPLDVELWWAYFGRVAAERPFVRLGASCVLENIVGDSAEMFSLLESAVSFLSPRNTVFFKLHQHGGDAPHGDDLLAILERAGLENRQIADLEKGAQNALVMYLRLVHWALHGKCFVS